MIKTRRAHAGMWRLREPAGILVPARAPDPYPPPRSQFQTRCARPAARPPVRGRGDRRMGARAPRRRGPLAAGSAGVGARCRSKAQMRLKCVK
jgi:hypothetical protein